MMGSEKSKTLKAPKLPLRNQKDQMSKSNTLPVGNQKKKAPLATPRATNPDQGEFSSADNWRVRSRDKAEEILQLYVTGRLADCTFVIGKEGNSANEPVTFKCHSIILATASSYLEHLLFQKSGDEQKLNFSMPQLSPTAFDLIMRHIYGNRCIFPGPEVGVEMCRTAHAWKLPVLAEEAEKYLTTHTGPDHALIVYEMFAKLSNEMECQRLMKIIQRYPDHVLQTKYWVDVSKETVKDVLCCCSRVLSVKQRFDALCEWGDAQVIFETGSVGNNAQVREKIDTLLPLVGFETLSAKDFATYYAQEQLLSPTERLELLVSLVLKM
ncbi:uncharacterized protein LOC132195491 [Neocloeon triangulifer]|uniref:uncharacterized protein LOC132195491 n=1 Tax=Neocloeon triangulifer TaxID=2078957 RepID=UPI00286F34A9|nr:uncharacterized protein LOC132195491 [Neocloeon triangulifer]